VLLIMKHAIDVLFEENCQLKAQLRELSQSYNDLHETTWSIHQINHAFFNHDNDGSEGNETIWQYRVLEWHSLEKYLINNSPIIGSDKTPPITKAK